MQGGWVPVEWFELIVSLLFGALAFLWLGITYRVYVTDVQTQAGTDERLVRLETYADPRNEDLRNKLLMSQFREMLAQMELRLGNNLEAKRSSIESTIKSQVGEVVRTIKNGGGE